MGGDKSVTAIFTKAAVSNVITVDTRDFVLTLSKSGSGVVTSNPSGINCGPTCSGVFLSGTSIVLNAIPDAGFALAGWLDCDSVNGNDCSVTMSAAKTVAATFSDNAPPVGTITINNNAAVSNTNTVTLNLTCTDASGCVGMMFSNDNLNWSTAESYASVKTWALPTGDGSKTIYVKLKDTVGNWSEPVSDTITLDTVAPVTTPSSSGGTFAGAQNITLSVSEGAIIYYTIDDSDPRTSLTRVQYVNPIPVNTSMTLKYYSLDSAGNLEEVKTQVYNIRYTLSISKTGTGTGTVVSTPTGISCGGDCSEAYESGTQVVLTPAADSGFTFTGWAGCDNLSGNDCTVTLNTAKNVQASFNDLTPPTGTVIYPGGMYATERMVILNVSALDASGIAGMRYSTNNGQSWTESPYAGAFIWDLGIGDGQKILLFQFRDGAGLWSESYPCTLTLDKAGPNLTLSALPDGSYTNQPTLTMSGSVTDVISGMKSLTVNGESVAILPDGQFVFNAALTSGSNSMMTIAEDCAGNRTIDTRTIILDMTAPVTTASPTGGIYLSPQRVTLSTSEMATVYYTLDGTPPTLGSLVYSNGPIAIDASSTLRFFAVDVAGNVESPKQEEYVIDRVLMGDVNHDGVIDNQDAILALQVLSGIDPVTAVYKEADINGDGKIALDEVLYILQAVAGVR